MTKFWVFVAASAMLAMSACLPQSSPKSSTSRSSLSGDEDLQNGSSKPRVADEDTEVVGYITDPSKIRFAPGAASSQVELTFSPGAVSASRAGKSEIKLGLAQNSDDEAESLKSAIGTVAISGALHSQSVNVDTETVWHVTLSSGKDGFLVLYVQDVHTEVPAVNRSLKEQILLVRLTNLSAGGLALPAAYPHAEASMIAAGYQHSCALIEGRVTCWGNAAGGRTAVPQDLKDVLEVESGTLFTCARTERSVSCWGSDYDNAGQTNVPAQYRLSGVKEIAVGSHFACALKDKRVGCWGWNLFGQTNVPPGLTEVTAISAGGMRACAITVDEKLRCWGGKDANGNEAEPGGVPPADLAGVLEVSVGRYLACARTRAQGLRCWGVYEGMTHNVVPLEARNSAMRVAVGWNHVCALLQDGKPFCWKGTSRWEESSTRILAEKPLKSISIGGTANHTCFVVSGAVKCVGLDDAGQSRPPQGL